MPCFKGIAVSIHASGAPISEYGIQKQSRMSRISSYIPVPHPKVDADTNKPEPAHFAISITLLTPGLAVPYSTPKPTPGNPKPRPKYASSSRNAQEDTVAPYVASSGSRKETIAAYIYFDGRAKEEVATLLRPGEETWVNSRWVQVPESEGGGLAEREFLFREVGLERWLNGLDLEGDETPEKLEKRRQKFERQRLRQQARADGITNSSEAAAAAAAASESASASTKEKSKNGRPLNDTLRYGDDDTPLEFIFDDSSSSEDDDDEPPESTGQIKIAMFRVLASGEVKRGEYLPQFDAHDDDEDASGNGAGQVEHTTSFAKPKTLDPSTISTQTVTGIDPPDKPYATFTYFYRGERQLRKLSILPTAKPVHAPIGSAKRRSGQIDLSSLGPLRKEGTVGFSAFREKDANEGWTRRKSRRKSQLSPTGEGAGVGAGMGVGVGVGVDGAKSRSLDEDSDEDEDDDILHKMTDVSDDKNPSITLDTAENSSQVELADGVNRIRLKRAHSAEPLSEAQNASTSNSKDSSSGESSPTKVPTSDIFGSPLKKHRPSLHAATDSLHFDPAQAHTSLAEVLAQTSATPSSAISATSAGGLGGAFSPTNGTASGFTAGGGGGGLQGAFSPTSPAADKTGLTAAGTRSTSVSPGTMTPAAMDEEEEL